MNGKVEPADHLPSAAWDELQQVVARFEEAWEAGQRPTITHFWPAPGVHRLSLLVELVHTDLEYRLKAGEKASCGGLPGDLPGIGRRPLPGRTPRADHCGSARSGGV